MPKKPAQVKGLTLRAKDYKTIEIKFKTVAGAKGYQIYQSKERNGTYKYVRLFKTGNLSEKAKRTKIVTYNRGGHKAKTKYYYKVRAYTSYMDQGVKKFLYGDFSSIKSAATTDYDKQTTSTPVDYEAYRDLDEYKYEACPVLVDRSVYDNKNSNYNYYYHISSDVDWGDNRPGDSDRTELFILRTCIGYRNLYLEKSELTNEGYKLKVKNPNCVVYYTVTEDNDPSLGKGIKKTRADGERIIKPGPNGQVCI